MKSKEELAKLFEQQTSYTDAAHGELKEATANLLQLAGLVAAGATEWFDRLKTSMDKGTWENHCRGHLKSWRIVGMEILQALNSLQTMN